MESITSNSTRRVTKKELIEAINRAFPDCVTDYCMYSYLELL